MTVHGETAEQGPARPLPTPTPESAPYWQAAREHRLTVQHCTACGLNQFYPPRVFCRRCMSDLEWIDCSGRGTVVASSTVVRAPSPAFEPDAPYSIVLIQLEEGIRLLSRIRDIPPGEEPPTGAAVTVVFEDVTADVTLPVFRLAETA